MTSAAVVAQSAAGGHSANMWLQCLAATVLITAVASKEVFTNSFLVRFKRSVGHEVAHEVAQRHGFESLGPAKTVRRINNILIHEDYDSEDIHNDIALLQMDRIVTFSPFIKRAIISDVFPTDVAEASVAGWGLIDDSTRIASIKLKSTTQKIIENEKCVWFKNSSGSMMCAGDPDSDQDRPTEGDSGSGLITSKYQLIGLISFRLDETPGLVVYTSVPYYYNWIMEGLKKIACDIKKP